MYGLIGSSLCVACCLLFVCCVLLAACWLLCAGCGLLWVACCLLLLVDGWSVFVVRCVLSFVCWFVGVSACWFVVCCWLGVCRWLLPVACCPLFVDSCLSCGAS